MKTLSKTANAMFLGAAILVGLAGPAMAQGTSASDVFINSKDIKWGAVPPWMPQGAKIAVLQGDPGKSGPFVIRLMVPPGYKIPPHLHSQDESLTVIEGTVYFGPGDKIDTTKAQTVTAGGFHFLSGKDHHYLVAKTQAVVQVSGTGPFDISYIDSHDDPQNAKN